MRRIRLALAAAPLVLLAALGGCSSDDPEPRIDPAPSASDSVDPSGSGTPTVHSTPAPVALTPEETVRAWVDAQNVALASGDTSGMSALSADGCRGCSNFIDPIKNTYADGGSYSTSGWVLDGVDPRAPATDRVALNVAVTIAGGTTVSSAGATPVTYEVQKRLLVFRMILQDGRWLITLAGFIQ